MKKGAIKSKINNFNVIGSSNGIMIIFKDSDIKDFPENMEFKDNGIIASFYIKNKRDSSMILSSFSTPCKKALHLACHGKKHVDCVFMIITKNSKRKMRSYTLKNNVVFNDEC